MNVCTDEFRPAHKGDVEVDLRVLAGWSSFRCEARTQTLPVSDNRLWQLLLFLDHDVEGQRADHEEHSIEDPQQGKPARQVVNVSTADGYS